jgi:vacuolar-type H+-ATPase subunit F/Vma7
LSIIVLANEEFATGLRLAGVKNSHIITRKEEAESILKGISKHEFIIATQKVIDMYPKLEDYENVELIDPTLYL